MIAFYLPGGIPVYTFALALALGASIGLAWVAWQAPRAEVHLRLNAGLWALFGGLVGARAAYVGLNWAYYQSHPGESLQVFLGGLNGFGALTGGILALALYAARSHLRFAQLADGLLPLLALLIVAALLGCWVEGCAYGPIVDTWWGVPARDEWGEMNLRWPIQPVASLITILIFWLIERARPHLPGVGLATALALLGLALEIVFFAPLRADPVSTWWGARLDTWAAVILSAVAILLTLRARKT